MNWLFRRHFWLLHLMLLGVTALIAAKIVTTLVGFWVSQSIPELPPRSFFKAPPEEPAPKDFSTANERNLFMAKREHISLLDGEELADSTPNRWQDAILSSLPLKLVSTMVFFDPFDSRAVIQSTSGSAKVYTINDCMPYHKNYDERRVETILPPQDWEQQLPCNNIDGIATVVRIEEYRVYIFNERDRKYEYLSLLAEDKMPIREKVSVHEEDEGTGVRKVGATSYEIDQKELDKALSNIARLLTEARAVPELDAQGNYIGFKIVYLKEGSLFEKIGIERMDVLTRINGYELNSPDKALQVFSKLRGTASQFTIDLERGDSRRKVTLDYSVVR